MLQKKLDEITTKLVNYGGIVDETDVFYNLDFELNDDETLNEDMFPLLKEKMLQYRNDNVVIILVDYVAIYEDRKLVDTARKAFGIYHFHYPFTFANAFRNLFKLGELIGAHEVFNATMYFLDRGEYTYYHMDYEIEKEFLNV